MHTISERDRKLIWHPFTQAKIAPHPIAISRAQGCYLYTDNGKKLFDGVSSWWTSGHGHCHPHIANAVAKQAQTLDHVIFADFTHEPAVRLAEMLTSHAPSGLNKVFYADNGSTAVETAIKMAYQYWQHRKEDRPFFVALEHGYHGDTFGAMSVSDRSTFTKPFWPLLFNVLRTKSTCVSDVSATRSEEEITEDALAHFRALLRANKDKIAGIIIEPMMQMAAGMRIFTKGFLSGIRRLCTEHNILLIADEVATGFYRTGHWFASNHENVSPDIMCLSKTLTGGVLPLSATLVSDKIYDAFLSDEKADALLHGHSFTGNPLGCAAAIASMELFQQDNVKNQIADIVETTAQSIVRISDAPRVKNARVLGTISVIELEADAGYLSHVSDQIYRDCFEQGLYIRPLGSVLYLLPPLCATSQEILWAHDIINKSLRRGFN